MQGGKGVNQELARVPITTIPVRTLFKCPRNWTQGMSVKNLDSTFYRYASAWMEMGLVERRKAPHGSRRGYEYRRRVKSITFHEDCTMSFEMIDRR